MSTPSFQPPRCRFYPNCPCGWFLRAECQPMAALHFVGFRGDEYSRAVRIFGRPDFIHIGWDLRAQREIAPGDVIVFAQGDADRPPSVRSFPDIIERGDER